MAQEFHPGQTVPESGVYRVSHDPVHPDMPHEVTVIKGRRFPTCRGCKGISFELVHAAKHIDEVDQLAEPDMAALGTAEAIRLDRAPRKLKAFCGSRWFPVRSTWCRRRRARRR